MSDTVEAVRFLLGLSELPDEPDTDELEPTEREYDDWDAAAWLESRGLYATAKAVRS